MKESKPKFSKKKCLTCKYHGINGIGCFLRKGRSTYRVYCNYAGITGETCTKILNNKELIDIRGGQYDKCLLYEKGKSMVIKE